MLVRYEASEGSAVVLLQARNQITDGASLNANKPGLVMEDRKKSGGETQLEGRVSHNCFMALGIGSGSVGAGRGSLGISNPPACKRTWTIWFVIFQSLLRVIPSMLALRWHG